VTSEGSEFQVELSSGRSLNGNNGNAGKPSGNRCLGPSVGGGAFLRRYGDITPGKFHDFVYAVQNREIRLRSWPEKWFTLPFVVRS